MTNILLQDVVEEAHTILQADHIILSGLEENLPLLLSHKLNDRQIVTINGESYIIRKEKL